MPHKRARQPVRKREKAQRTTDSAPKTSIEHEPIPKSVSRILDAEQIRREYRRKRQHEDTGYADKGDVKHKKRRLDVSCTKDDGRGTAALKIKPDETVVEFNRRVESSMMPLVKSALRQSSAQARKVRREAAAQQTLKRTKQVGQVNNPRPASSKKDPDPPSLAVDDEETVNPRHPMKEFQGASTSAPRRLNDIVQEPPVIKKTPHGAIKNDAAPPAGLSMVQKVMMEEERNRAIRHYRELKARKLRGVKLDGSRTEGQP